MTISNLTTSVSLTETRHCVHAGFVVVDILIKLVVFHEEKLVKQFGSEVFLLVNIMLSLYTFEILQLWGSGSLNIVMTSNSCNLSMEVWNGERLLCIMVTWLYTPDLRYIQRFSEVMTFCPRILPCIPIWAATLMRNSLQLG